jgi:hypothetical protein
MSEERWREAIDLFLSAAHYVASNWEIAWNAGWAYYKAEDYQNAVETLRRSTELHQTKPPRGGRWVRCKKKQTTSKLRRLIFGGHSP